LWEGKVRCGVYGFAPAAENKDTLIIKLAPFSVKLFGRAIIPSKRRKKKMNRRERLMATLRGEPVDRLAVNLYEIGGLVMDPNDPDRFNIYNDPSWKPLLDLAENHTDLIRMRSPVRTESHRAWGDQSGTKSVRDEFFKVENIEENGCQITRITLTVGGRTMTTLTKREPDIDTVWTTEHLLKSKEDVLAYLQLPDEVFTENIDVTPLLAEEEASVRQRRCSAWRILRSWR
jgi:hypothetical protein